VEQTAQESHLTPWSTIGQNLYPSGATQCGLPTVGLELLMSQEIAEEQSLRLMRAFFNVHESDTRERIVELVEAAGRGARITATTVDKRPAIPPEADG
jgi:hypothetical protein